MNIFQTYNDKILKLLKAAKENNLLALPENLSGITPSKLWFKILTPKPIEMGAGRIIDYYI